MELTTFAFPVCVGSEVTCILEFFSPACREPDGLLLETIGEVATQLSRVAERQRARDQLAKARDAAMESSRLKSDFLATMSHEIRTPMNGVIGLTGLLLSTGLDGQQRQYAEGVQSAGEALLAIINDILDFSKIESGRLELEVIDFDLVQVVEEAAALVTQAAQRKGLELVACCASDLPNGFRGDPARLRQVLLNLASNAVKFTSEGEVIIRATRHEPSGDDLIVHFEVVDTGIGISEADHHRLFEPFSQADASTTRRFGGTGLGLAISRRLVAAMGGELGFDSVPGCGSTFWFTVRLERQVAVAPLQSPAGGLRVLVVDDNKTNRLTLGDKLRAWDIPYDLASDGPSALVMAQEAAATGQRYDVALIDAVMPGMDGAEVAMRISADPALSRTSLVLMTPASAAGWTRTSGGGIAACLTKPVRIFQLWEALAHAGEGGPPQRLSPLPLAPPPHTRGHILVVEDNASNQLVAVGTLRLLGFRADVASDGVEALDTLARTTYDAILMDCQMPEMDGFTTTAEIRRREGAVRLTPIIAMTAGATDTDRERCLAAGMDDFLTKPIKPSDVDGALTRWVGTGGVAGHPAEKPDEVPDARPGGQVIDRGTVAELRALTPDGSLFVEVVDTFLRTGPDHVAELLAAVSNGDLAWARRSAHRLRGESSALGAIELSDLCTSLETRAEEGWGDGAPALASAIETAFDRAAAELGDIVGQSA